MPYQIIFRARAKREYVQSVGWYRERSIQAAENFVAQIEAVVSAIQEQPDFYRKTYKQYREARAKKYPYSIVYFVDEVNDLVVITSVFHQKRNPADKFSK